MAQIELQSMQVKEEGLGHNQLQHLRLYHATEMMADVKVCICVFLHYATLRHTLTHFPNVRMMHVVDIIDSFHCSVLFS